MIFLLQNFKCSVWKYKIKYKIIVTKKLHPFRHAYIYMKQTKNVFSVTVATIYVCLSLIWNFTLPRSTVALFLQLFCLLLKTKILHVVYIYLYNSLELILQANHLLEKQGRCYKLSITLYQLQAFSMGDYTVKSFISRTAGSLLHSIYC